MDKIILVFTEKRISQQFLFDYTLNRLLLNIFKVEYHFIFYLVLKQIVYKVVQKFIFYCSYDYYILCYLELFHTVCDALLIADVIVTI